MVWSAINEDFEFSNLWISHYKSNVLGYSSDYAPDCLVYLVETQASLSAHHFLNLEFYLICDMKIRIQMCIILLNDV